MSIIIRAPPENVWEMLAWDRTTEWIAEYKSVDYTSEIGTPKDKYRVGASAKVVSETAGKKKWSLIMKSRKVSKMRK